MIAASLRLITAHFAAFCLLGVVAAACGTQVGNPDDEETPRATGSDPVPSDQSSPPATETHIPACVIQNRDEDADNSGILDVLIADAQTSDVVTVIPPTESDPVPLPAEMLRAGDYRVLRMRSDSLICSVIVTISAEQTHNHIVITLSP